MSATTKTAQIRLARLSPACWRITFDNPPLNVLGPDFVLGFREIMNALEMDEQVRVVVFDSAVDGFFLNHSDFLAKFGDLTSIPQGPTGLEAWPDILVRLTHAPFVWIASFDTWAVANTKRLVNASSVPPDVEIAAGWDTCMVSITRPTAQSRTKTAFEQGFHKLGDVENRPGEYAGGLGR